MPPHSYTASLSRLLGQRPHLSQIKQIHAQIITHSFASTHISLSDSLIHCYLHVENLNFARTVFDHYPLPPPPPLLWNLMIRAYRKLRHPLESINFFCKMLTARVSPDEYTFTFVTNSCANHNSNEFGEIVHGMAMKMGYSHNLCVASSLIGMYAAFSRVDDAYTVFDELPVRNVVTWTSLICAYAKNGNMSTAAELFDEIPVRNSVTWAVMISGFVRSEMYEKALRYFHNMLCEVNPNEAVLVSSLSACAHIGSLNQGKLIHGYMDEHNIPQTTNISNTLIDMYAKCGRISCAYQIFCKIPRRDVYNYTSMISGLSIHGRGEDALKVFQQMSSENLNPNPITILGVLNACSHSGLVLHGSLIFYNMEGKWGIVPKIEHYGCYIDLLGRAGYLAKAFSVLKQMPLNPDVAVWRSLLSSCRIHRNASFGERVLNCLELLDPKSCDGVDVLLARVYASVGRSENFVLLKKKMGKRTNLSDIGCSWMEVNGIVHEFRVADSFHPQISKIKEKLSEILKRVRLVGYTTDATQVSFDINEEDKEQAVAFHSEKLAIAFGLMNTQQGDSIRISKNLRTCEDCHKFFKAISEVYDIEIVVRDRSRFHTFAKGNCSCKDYW